MKGESGRDGLDGTDGVQGPPGNVLIIPTNTGSKGPDNRHGHYHFFLLAFCSYPISRGEKVNRKTHF